MVVKLSNLIEEGSRLFWPVTHRGHWIEYDADECLLCPLSMAYMASGGNIKALKQNPVGTAAVERLGTLMNINEEVRGPDGQYYYLTGLVLELFDHEEWSIAEIVKYLRSINQ